MGADGRHPGRQKTLGDTNNEPCFRMVAALPSIHPLSIASHPSSPSRFLFSHRCATLVFPLPLVQDHSLQRLPTDALSLTTQPCVTLFYACVCVFGKGTDRGVQPTSIRGVSIMSTHLFFFTWLTFVWVAFSYHRSAWVTCFRFLTNSGRVQRPFFPMFFFLSSSSSFRFVANSNPRFHHHHHHIIIITIIIIIIAIKDPSSSSSSTTNSSQETRNDPTLQLRLKLLTRLSGQPTPPFLL